MEYKIERMETPKIVNYLKADPTVWNLGVLLALQTGLRVGELAALKRDVCHIDQSIKTYCTMLIDAGCEDSIIMNQLGHASIETSRKYYYFSNRTKQH